MKGQIIEISGQYPLLSQVNRGTETTISVSYPDGAFWLQVYPPLSDGKLPLSHSRFICPWGMAAELEDVCTTTARRQSLLDALKRGLKTIRQYDLPANRIRFAEDCTTHSITVWVD